SHCRRTLKCGWSDSTSGRSNSGVWADFFFQPLQLHLEAADLLEEFGLLGLGVGDDRLGAVGEERLGSGEEVLLPAVDQGRGAGVVGRQFVDGAIALECGQCDLDLEGGRVLLALACHEYPFPGPQSSLLSGPVFGVHYKERLPMSCRTTRTLCGQRER